MVARKIRDAQDARACLSAAEGAGLAPREWAHRHGVNARSLHMWRVLLARGRGTASVASEPLRLVELVPLPPPPPAPARPARARYVLSCGLISLELDVAVDPIDMRGSFDAIAGRVRGLRLDPQDGHLYVFVNRRRTLMKILFFEPSGWVLVAKRLERGTFQVPDTVDPNGGAVGIPSADLGLILEGVDLRAPRRLRRRREGSAEN